MKGESFRFKPSRVTLAAIQALYVKSKEVNDLRTQLEELRVIVDALQSDPESNSR